MLGAHVWCHVGVGLCQSCRLVYLRFLIRLIIKLLSVLTDVVIHGAFFASKNFRNRNTFTIFAKIDSRPLLEKQFTKEMDSYL